MTRRTATLCAALTLPVAALAVLPGGTASADDAPVRAVVVSGAGVASYPAFDDDVARYGVTTTDATDGSITVTATTSDPAGVVYVDGRPDADGVATVTGLAEGDEVSVWIADAAGTSRWSYVYLPADFPALEAETVGDPADLAPGHVLLGISNNWLDGFGGGAAVPDYVETAVDRNGVPVHVESFPDLPRTLDLKRQPNGHYSVARTTSTPGRTGEAIVELDARFEEVARHQTVGLVNTDGHDAILEPDGTAWLMAYEPNADTGLLDSVIQRVDPTGAVTFQWTSAPYAAETVAAGPDYAHLNSFEVMADGSILASFRNLSAVFKIDTSTPTGSVVWKLGGRDSDFAITDQQGDPDGGPCAQHSAHELPNGDVVLFDNGSSSVFENLCLTPGDPEGPTVQRVQSRAITLDLDEQAGTASIVRSYAPAGRFAWFAGSTQPLPAGRLLIGWASATQAVATELDAAGGLAWELRDPDADTAQRYFSYRAHLADVPDAEPPVVTLSEPAVGASYVQGDVVTASWSCTDRGGSSLQTCAGPDEALDTSTPGRHEVTITATDGAGGSTTVTRRYTVRASYRPDAVVRVKGSAAWTGDGRYGPASGQRVAADLRRASGRAIVQVRLQNDGAVADRLRYTVAGSSKVFQVRPSEGRSGTTPLLAPGASYAFSVQVTRSPNARPGNKVVVSVAARSVADPSLTDGVSARVTARR